MSVMLNVFVMIILQANETFFWPFCVSVINMQDKLSAIILQECQNWSKLDMRLDMDMAKAPCKVEYRFIMFMWIKQIFYDYVLKVTHFLTKATKFELTC